MPTGEFHIIEHPQGERVLFVPTHDTPLPTDPPPQIPTCGESHGRLCVRMDRAEEDIKETKAEIKRLRLLPWKVVGAALGAGASIATIVELLRWLFSVAGG